MDKPLGYWLKHLDNLIEATFERTLTTHDLTRRHWQVLNTIAAAPTEQADLNQALAPFQAHVESEVDDLVDRRWATRATTAVMITDDGTAAYDVVKTQIHAARRRVTNGIPDDEYQRTVATLQRMAENLR